MVPTRIARTVGSVKDHAAPVAPSVVDVPQSMGPTFVPVFSLPGG
jgi:hypothetical protein